MRKYIVSFLLVVAFIGLLGITLAWAETITNDTYTRLVDSGKACGKCVDKCHKSDCGSCKDKCSPCKPVCEKPCAPKCEQPCEEKCSPCKPKCPKCCPKIPSEFPDPCRGSDDEFTRDGMSRSK